MMNDEMMRGLERHRINGPRGHRGLETWEMGSMPRQCVMRILGNLLESSSKF